VTRKIDGHPSKPRAIHPYPNLVALCAVGRCHGGVGRGGASTRPRGQQEAVVAASAAAAAAAEPAAHEKGAGFVHGEELQQGHDDDGDGGAEEEASTGGSTKRQQPRGTHAWLGKDGGRSAGSVSRKMGWWC